MSFMDGPLTVKCTLIADEILELCFVKEYTDGEDIFLSTECIVDNLKKSLLAAARKVLREINNRKWDTPDIVSLRNIAESWEQFVD